MILTPEIIEVYKKVIKDKTLTAYEMFDKLIDLDEINRSELIKEYVKNNDSKKRYDMMNDREQRVYDMNQFIRDCKEAKIDYDINVVKKLYKL